MEITVAWDLLNKYVKRDTLKRHCLTVSAVMAYWAGQEGEDVKLWECTGLLHDLDFEQFPGRHCMEVRNILEKEKQYYPDITEEIIRAVQSHGWKRCCDVQPLTRMEKVLYTTDELTGLIFACAMARPSKSVADMETKSVMKKFKTPAFASGCSREAIKEGADMLGLELEEAVGRCIRAMRLRHQELGV